MPDLLFNEVLVNITDHIHHSYHHQYYDMALSSGIYTIQNVKNSNWAMLLGGNDEGEVVAGSSANPNVGEKVEFK